MAQMWTGHFLTLLKSIEKQDVDAPALINIDSYGRHVWYRAYKTGVKETVGAWKNIKSSTKYF